jgi:hypothetical protein
MQGYVNIHPVLTNHDSLGGYLYNLQNTLHICLLVARKVVENVVVSYV